MLNFYNFLLEQLEVNQLKHLEHPEDHVIHAGEAGYHHSINALNAVHEYIKSKKPDSNLKVTTKFDGSPSVVFGYHPEHGKFFVATKSAFNKNPKLNFSEQDIEENHGHSPGLVEKLKEALKYLPKIMPKKDTQLQSNNTPLQCDIMYTHNDISTHGGHHHFKPNTMTYSAPENSETGKKIKESKLGIVIHTKYNGTSLDNMKAGFNVDRENFKDHKDVHNISPEVDINKTNITPDQSNEFNSHMKKAESYHNKLKKSDGYSVTTPHQEHLKIYINSTVRNNTKPSVNGYKEFLKNRGENEASKVKTDAAKSVKMQKYNNSIEHVNNNNEHFENILNLHHHIQQAKNVLVKSLDSGSSDFKTSIDGNPSGHEGYVATHLGNPIKLVDRAGFSAANLNRPKPGSKKEKE